MCCCAGNSVAQELQVERNDSLLQYFTFTDPPPFSCLLAFFPPAFIQNGIELKSFIRSEIFKQVRNQYGDLRAVDAIFVRAMQMTNNNTALSLLMAAIATFDHDVVGVKVPVLQLCFPLSSEPKEEFADRINNLPAHFYSDSPVRKEGDRDKLQHFFGSSFLTFVFESPQTAERFGEFVEHGEDAFIIGGVLDDRDFRANRHGQEFGLALLENNHRLPSEFLRTIVASKSLSSNEVSTCPGVW